MQISPYGNTSFITKRSTNLAKAVALTVSMAGGMTASHLAMAADSNVITNNPISSSNRSYELLSQTLDWVPLSELTPSQRDALAPGSCGAYIAPLRTDNDAALDPESAPIRATANRSRVFDKEGSTAEDATQIILIGDVIVTQGYRQIKADQAQLDQESGILVVDGQLELREPGLLVLGSDAIVKQNEDTLTVNQASYALQNESIRGTATRIDKTSDDRLKLKSATYTQCAPGNNTWSLKGSQITLNPQSQQGFATNVRIYVKGIPVFYFPYFRFPIGDKRLSGFLTPTINFDDDGLNISTPYYFNLAPNYDLVFTPHIVSGHGALFEGNFRHLNTLFESNINAAFLSNDDSDVDDDDQDLVDNGTITEEDAAPFAGEDRWLFNFDQTGGLGKRWSTRIDYSRVSDIDFFRDFDSQISNTQDDNFLNQRLLASYQFPNWRLGLNAVSYQILDDTIIQPFTQLPALSADGFYHFAHSDNSYFTVDLDHEWTRFDETGLTSSNTTNDERPTGDRFRIDYKATWRYEPEAGFLRPSVALRHLQYNLDTNNFAADADRSPSITVPQASIDGGLFFERDAGSYLQTFEPRLFYFYSEFEDHDDLFDITTDGQDIDFDTSELTFNFNQLFRDTRFAGGDRIDDANQLSLGLTTRFFSNTSGRELFSASAGQIYFFDDREVTLSNVEQTDSRSAIAAQLSANPTKNWRISTDILYDDENNETDLGNIRLRYKSDSKHVFNVNYRFVRAENELNTVRQVDTSFIAPLHKSNRWHLLAYSSYDTLLERELDTLAAVEYNGCCYSIRFGFRRELDTALVNVIADNDLEFDEQVFIQFQLKGLGGTRGQTNSLFSENINGFEDWQAIYDQ